MVEIAICRRREFQCPEANVIQGLVVNAEGLVRVFDELMDGESRIVRLEIA